jgi:serine/threonine protein kinase
MLDHAFDVLPLSDFFLSQCATLQHPFEARNQCALIMKIIEAQVKIPSNLQLSSDLRNLILWLLRKDPNARPSIKDILNEVSRQQPYGIHCVWFISVVAVF